MRSRFNSPASVTSNRGMFGGFRGRLVFEHNHAAQMSWPVRVETFFYSGVQTQELLRRKIQRKPRQLRPVGLQFHHKVGSTPGAVVRPIGYHESDAAQFLDLFQYFEFGLVTRLREKEHDQGLLADDRFRAVPEF